MTPKIRKRLIEELEHERRFLWEQISDSIADFVEKVLKEGEETCCENCDAYGKYDFSYKISQHWCMYRTCPCHTPSSAKVELPEKLGTYKFGGPAENVLFEEMPKLYAAIDGLIDYLSAKEKESQDGN